MANRQESIPRLIRSLPIRQQVFVGFLFLLALVLSFLVVRYIDPSPTMVHQGSVDRQPLTFLRSVVLG